MCREALGDGGAEPAAYLQPVPPGAVVYGSGGAAVVVTKVRCAACSGLPALRPQEQAAALCSWRVRQAAKSAPALLPNPLPVAQEQAAALYSLNMRQYSALKAQLVGATAVLVGLGSGLAYAAGGRDLALPFALGGTSGVLYQFMLQVGLACACVCVCDERSCGAAGAGGG